ncbi:leucyl aminopeptidase [Spongiibacter nanhainus]|uniref:Probable cytosol aminopeptidase n=1 Tax=Spongiibacter nanhainus TaxID=2794344 RepID=A0A7T4UNV3_9GAMM|nr:leucyl aminopeptidase [Spongiibacter nanhainus]QQD16942.1 leucyl aminopeptidase [Spongiibacter nanhainus]
MQITLKPITDLTGQTGDCLAVFCDSGLRDAAVKKIDTALNGQLSALVKSGDFHGKLGETLLLPAPAGIKAKRLLLVGRGKDSAVSAQQFDKLINACLKKPVTSLCRDLSIAFTDLTVSDRDASWPLQRAAQLIEVAGYRYTATVSKPKAASSLRKVTLQAANTAANRAAVNTGRGIGLGVNTARELGNLPGNICTPSHLAKEARKLGRRFDNVKVSVLEEAKMKQLGMGSLLSVTAGTDQPAKLIVIEYQGGKKTDAPHVLVGKGITFDTGGISLKPGAKMDEMKFDMCGAASVVGTLEACAEMGAKVNVVGIIAAAENMPSGGATKPGDVVTSMSGQTIEVLNTDAEGRLVLCDALTYAGRYKPASVIDIATLTGACVVALGKHAIGLYSNQDDFASELMDCGQRAQDRAWQMPLWDDYQRQLDSNFADIANIGGPEAGSITAACFLSRFCKDYRWAHLDIAGAAWLSGGQKGATGRPVGLLCEYLLSKAGK